MKKRASRIAILRTLFLALSPILCSVFLFVAQTHAQSTYEPYRFTTFAGLAPGSADGTGSAARFNEPTAVAVDNAGNIYVADRLNNTIRKITPDGVVSTLAGSPGVIGSADGIGSAALFNVPRGIAVDGAGNVYVADTSNDTIRKITPGGVVTTLAGLAGSSGSMDGTGSAARFKTPFGVAVDGAGNVYVADTDNSTIRLITLTGVVTTLGGVAGSIGSMDGTGSAARFSFPSGVAVDGVGNVYVADTDNSTIRQVTSTGVVTTLAGLAGNSGSMDGTGSAAQFSFPYGITVDGAGNLYVADTNSATIRQVTSAGVVTTLAGLAGSFDSKDGTGSAARFNSPIALAVDNAGNTYVADSSNNTIRKITPAGVVTTLAGLAGATGSLDDTGSAARFNGPRGIAVDGAGNLYGTDTLNHTLRMITPAGVVTTLAGLAGSSGSMDGTGSAARFKNPRGCAVDSAGNVYLADQLNFTIRKVTSGGVVTTLAGLAGINGRADGTGSAAHFSGLRAVAVDSSGNVYVADSGNQSIRMVTPGGVVTTLAGLAGFPGSADGTGSSARFNLPSGIAVDGNGNVYVADSGNNTIRKIIPAGVTTTLAGLAGILGSDDGTGSAARFNFPEGIAVDSAGKVYVADAENNSIRAGTPSSAPLLNISTRLDVQTGDNVLIGGFIITGTASKQVLIRGIGPSLANNGVQGALADPTLELHSGNTTLATNDNWKIDDATGQSQEAAIEATTIPPTNDAESAILFTLQPGPYTAILAGKDNTSGVGLIEAYDLSPALDSQTANISTRGIVQTGDNVIIGGFILGGSGIETANVLIRAIGPSLTNVGVANALADPTLELHDGQGALIDSNDNWRSDHEAEIQATGIPPTNDLESALIETLTSGNYTAIVRGKGDTIGVGLVEVYWLQ